MYWQLGCCAALLFLGYLSYQDIKTKCVSARVIWIFGGTVLLYLLLGKRCGAEEWIVRMIPGVLLILLAWMTRESIGYGDGAAVIVLGLWCGTGFCIMTLCLGIFLSGIYALCGLAVRRTTPIPFLPFLLAAMEVILFYE